jgi:4'-phosphopantetheinyl transferase
MTARAGVPGGGLTARPVELTGPDGPWDAALAVLAEHGAVVGYGSLADWEPAELDDRRIKALIGHDWARYQSFRHDKARSRFLAARLLLKHFAAVVIASEAELIELAYLPGGRPYLRGCDQIDISLSHTDDILVVGVTRVGRIGVDVELADRPILGMGIEAQVCTPHESAMLQAIAEGRRNAALVRLWTLKEAYSKAIGQGLGFRFTEFGFRLGDPRARVLRPDGSPGTGDEWRFGTWLVGRRYTVSVALCDSGFGANVDLAADTMLDGAIFESLTS